MADHFSKQAEGSVSRSDPQSNRGLLLRWYVSSGTLSVPQAAGPIAFSLVALSVTGDASGGAAMILAMTLAQGTGAIPRAQLGNTLPLASWRLQ